MATKRKRGRLELVEVPVKPIVTQCGIAKCPYDSAQGAYYTQPHTHFSYGDYTFAVTARETIHEYDGPLFKWVDDNGRSSYGGNMQWDLPKDGKPGAWAEPDSKLLSTCRHGLHALLPGQRGFGGHGRLFVAESEGPVMFAEGKVVAMRLRLVREVDLYREVTPEQDAAYWKARVTVFTGKRFDYGYGYHFPPLGRAQFKDTREATIKAARRTARPLLAEYDRLTRAMRGFDGQEWTRLRGKPQLSRQDWNAYTDLQRERTKVRRKLRLLDQVVGTAQSTKLEWRNLPVEAITDPDLALYMSPKVPDVNPPNS